MLTKRQIEILSYLVKKTSIKARDLGYIFSVSEKTIRNEIHIINELAGSKIIISNNTGLFLAPSKRDIANSLLRKNISHSEDELGYRLLLHLLFHRPPQDFDELAEFYYISSTTLNRFLDRINYFLKSFDLKIVRKKRIVSLMGTFHCKRKLALCLLYKQYNNESWNDNMAESFFPDIDVKWVKESLFSVLYSFCCQIPDYCISLLLINICIILEIYPQESEAGLSEQDLSLLNSLSEETIEYQISSAFLQYIKKDHPAYLIKLMAKSMIGFVIPNEAQIPENDLEKIDMCLQQIFKCFNISLRPKTDLSALYTHIYNMLKRAQNHNSIYFSEVGITAKKTCFYEYGISLLFCRLFAQKYTAFSLHPIVFHDTEVSIAAVFLGRILEQCTLHQQENSPKLTCLQAVQRPSLIPQDTDLLISTRRFPQISLYHSCIITPCLTCSDQLRICHEITKCQNRLQSEEYRRLTEQYFDFKLFDQEKNPTDKNDLIWHMLNLLKEDSAINSTLVNEFYNELLTAEQCYESFVYPNIAILGSHLRMALRSRVAIYLNPEGISWSHTGRAKIVLLLALAPDEEKNHRMLLWGLLRLLSSTTNAALLKNTSAYEDFMKIIRQDID